MLCRQREIAARPPYARCCLLKAFSRPLRSVLFSQFLRKNMFTSAMRADYDVSLVPAFCDFFRGARRKCNMFTSAMRADYDVSLVPAFGDFFRGARRKCRQEYKKQQKDKALFHCGLRDIYFIFKSKPACPRRTVSRVAQVPSIIITS